MTSFQNRVSSAPAAVVAVALVLILALFPLPQSSLGDLPPDFYEGVYTEYFSCDPDCVDKCEEGDDDANDNVCVKIIEVDPDGFFVSFGSSCEFNCINKCYQNQLEVLHKGSCAINIHPETEVIRPGPGEDTETELEPAEPPKKNPNPPLAQGGDEDEDAPDTPDDEDAEPPKKNPDPPLAQGGDEDEDVPDTPDDED